MSVQYISDSKGTTTGVFIPIQEWNKLKKEYNLPEDGFQLIQSQKEELNVRIDYYQQNPNEVFDWMDVKKRLLAS